MQLGRYRRRVVDLGEDHWNPQATGSSKWNLKCLFTLYPPHTLWNAILILLLLKPLLMLRGHKHRKALPESSFLLLLPTAKPSQCLQQGKLNTDFPTACTETEISRCQIVQGFVWSSQLEAKIRALPSNSPVFASRINQSSPNLPNACGGPVGA